MWRRLGAAATAVAMAAVMATTSACSYAAWPSRPAPGPPGLTPRGQRCNTSKLAPHLDAVGSVYGGVLLFGGGFVFLTELARGDSGEAAFPGHDFVLAMSALYVGSGWLMMHLFGRAKRYGYRRADECVYRGAAPPAPRP